MINLANIFKRIEEAMCAATFAEAGEFKTAGQFLTSGKTANKKVLLGVGEQDLNSGTIRAALNLGQRMEANLEIVHLFQPPADEGDRAGRDEKVIGSFQERMQEMGVAYQPVFAENDPEQDLIRYVEKRRDIVCVVLSGIGDPKGRKSHEPSLSENLKQLLHCPVVMYAKPA